MNGWSVASIALGVVGTCLNWVAWILAINDRWDRKDRLDLWMKLGFTNFASIHFLIVACWIISTIKG